MATEKDVTLPRQRMLDAASHLFAKDGIRAVGIERILSEAKVARASLYQVFGSKDALIAAYLERQDEEDRASYRRRSARVHDPVEKILLVFDLAARDAKRRGFRGCRYLNAVTEFPDKRHPVHASVGRHRAWLTDTWTEALTAAGSADPGPVIAQLLLLYDGGLAGCKTTRSTEPIMRAKTMAADVLARALPSTAATDRSPARDRGLWEWRAGS
jgi:AcrR family transcriptional regulator